VTLQSRRFQRQTGAQTVEFALTASTFFVVLFAVIEIARALWTWSLLNEATRVGARLAAVCDINDSRIYQETSNYVEGLEPANVVVEYQYLPHTFNPTWTTVNGAAADPAVIRNADQVLVRVRIQDYAPSFLFLFGKPTLTAPPFETTLPAESLGWNPNSSRWESCAAK
jgi:Flp pilus assembly protein TadG